MSIDTSKTLKAFDKISGKMEFLTQHVHEYVLLTGFLESHSKGVMKAVKSIASANDELLVQTFISKLVYKLPQLRMGIKLSEFDKARARKIASAVITQVFIDNGVLKTDKRIESVTVNGNKKFHTRLYLILGGTYKKDLLKGIENKPGIAYQREVNGLKLNSFEKDFLKRVATQPFEVSSVCSKKLLMKGYSLKVDWNKKVDKNGKSLPEDPIVRRARYRSYAETIMEEVSVMPCFYLPMKYCGRDRMYYEATRLEGIRPHGKLWETLMIDSAVSYDLNVIDERVLKHLIYVTLHGRVGMDEANEKFSMEDLLEAQAIDPFEQEDEEAFGNAIFLNKCYQAIKDYEQGVPSKFIFGYDFTNSGLLMSGVSFKSERMMKAGNIAGESEVVDSHASFGAAYDMDLSRKDIKSIHMGLMHGSTLQSIATTISTATGKDVTSDDVATFNERAYGEPVSNITRIANWGTQIVGNEQTSNRWTLPDGFRASSRAYFKGVPLQVYVASASHKEGYTSHVLVGDMPWVEDKNGFPMYSKETVVGGITYAVEQKKRGLFADITHSNDAFMLRHIGRAVMATGRPILFKHDDFITLPSSYPTVQHAAKEVFSYMFQNNLYQKAVNEIAFESVYDIEPLELIEGNAHDTIWESENFLMP